MAGSYKDLNLDQDIVATRTLLHEQIPLTGTLAKIVTGKQI